jgi:hypothetical protein
VSWFSSVFLRPRPVVGGAASTESSEVAAPDRLAEIVDGLQKLTRVQARQGVRLEALENKLEGGFSDLRAVVQRSTPPPAPASIDWDELLDAADALDEAERTAIVDGNSAMAAGLSAVGLRIGRFLAQLDVRREKRVGADPDPAFVRVIGTVDPAEVQVELGTPGQAHVQVPVQVGEGQVARVVRATVIERGRVLREGEVLISRRASTTGQAAGHKEANP